MVLAALVAVSASQQYNKGQDAAILSEARYLSGDGKFGAAYVQEDGVEFKEESDADGTRRGSYSYVDPSGQRRTVHYTAGKDGFRATGDHLPVAPPAPAPVAPQPQYQPQPQYNPPQQQYNSAPQQYNAPQQQYQPQPSWQQYNSIPTTTPYPQQRNFHPPGKLSLSRTSDGFSYTFNKN